MREHTKDGRLRRVADAPVFLHPAYGVYSESADMKVVAPALAGLRHVAAADPAECIDCTLCVAECPVEAIFAEDDVPESQRGFIALNAELSTHWKPIVVTKKAPPDADAWAQVKDKKELLERSYAQVPADTPS